MKTVKVLFGAICILFIQGILTELLAQGILDSLRESKEIDYFSKTVTDNGYIIHVNNGYIISLNNEPLSNKFIEAFEKERKNASYTTQKKDENGETVSEIHVFREREGFILYAYDRVDYSNIDIIYVKYEESEVFPQKKITQENYEQLFNDFVETLKAHADRKRAKAAEKLAKVNNDHVPKNSANVQSVKYYYGKTKSADLFINGVKVTVEEAREMGYDVVEIDEKIGDLINSINKCINSINKWTNKYPLKSN
jgi:hypothetical protein